MRIVQTTWAAFAVAFKRIGVFALANLFCLVFAGPGPAQSGWGFYLASAVGGKIHSVKSSCLTGVGTSQISNDAASLQSRRHQKTDKSAPHSSAMTDTDDSDAFAGNQQDSGKQTPWCTPLLDLPEVLSVALLAHYSPISRLLGAHTLPLERGPPSQRTSMLRSIVARWILSRANNHWFETL